MLGRGRRGLVKERLFSAIRFIGWAIGAALGAVVGWWLGGLAPLLYLPDDLTYRMIGAVVIGAFGGILGLVGMGAVVGHREPPE